MSGAGVSASFLELCRSLGVTAAELELAITERLTAFAAARHLPAGELEELLELWRRRIRSAFRLEESIR